MSSNTYNDEHNHNHDGTQQSQSSGGATPDDKARRDPNHPAGPGNTADDATRRADDSRTERTVADDRRHTGAGPAVAGAGAGAGAIAANERRDRDHDGVDDRVESNRDDRRAVDTTDDRRTDPRREQLMRYEAARSQNRHLTDIGLLLLRVLPVVLVLDGIHKATGYQGFRGAVANNWFGKLAPDLFSIMVMVGEIALPILIFFGLFTRLAALLEAVMMFFIWFVMFVFNGHSFTWLDPKTGGPIGASALEYVMLALPLVFTGAGRYSLDHAIGRAGRERRAEKRVDRTLARG